MLRGRNVPRREGVSLGRAQSKARLVNALMVSGGMLKIDAVSLAETEG